MAASPYISMVERGTPEPLRLNLGSCDSRMKGYTSVDICEPADVITDLTLRWPWADSSVDGIAAWHIFEHLPSKRQTMNEAHRVLKPGCNLDLRVPTTKGYGAFQDPTHTSFWTPNDLFYYCEEYAEWRRFRGHYAISAHFRVISATHSQCPNDVWELRAVLQAVKP